MGDTDEKQLRSKQRPGETHEAAAKRHQWDVSEGRTEHGAARCSTLPTQGPEIRLEKVVIAEKTNLTESIRKKKEPSSLVCTSPKQEF